MDGGGDDGIVELFDEHFCDGMIGDSDPDGGGFADEQARHLSGRGQDEGVCAGQESFHDSIICIGNDGVSGDIFEVWTYKRERMFSIFSLHLIDAFDGFFLHHVAPESVDGVGGIDDESAFANDIGDARDLSCVGPSCIESHLKHVAPVVISMSISSIFSSSWTAQRRARPASTLWLSGQGEGAPARRGAAY